MASIKLYPLAPPNVAARAPQRARYSAQITGLSELPPKDLEPWVDRETPTTAGTVAAAAADRVKCALSGGAQLAASGQRATLDRSVVSLSPTCGVEIA